MGSKSDKNPLHLSDNPNMPIRYFESNTEPLLVHSTNPFNNFGGKKTNEENYRNENEFIDIFDQTANNEPIRFSAPSRELLDNILNDGNTLGNNVFSKIPYDDVKEAFSMQPHDTEYSRTMDPIELMTTCSRKYSEQEKSKLEDYYVNEANPFVINNVLNDSNENTRAEKTPYRRPVVNMYNQEYVFKTIQRNARLQKLVKKLVVDREKEKQRETWNNYINELKNKHKYYSNEPSKILPQYVPDEPTNVYIMDDTCNTPWKQSNLSQNDLHDIYGSPADVNLKEYYEYPRNEFSNIHQKYTNPYATQQFCYPTSSQCRIMMLNRERQQSLYNKEQCPYHPSSRYFNSKTIVVERDDECPDTNKCFGSDWNKQVVNNRYKYQASKFNIKKNSGCPAQRASPRETYALPLVDEEDDSEDEDDTEQYKKHNGFKEKLKMLTKSVSRLKNKVLKSEEDLKQSSLADIEGKIDKLIETLNLFMIEMKEFKNYRRDTKSTSVSCKLSRHSDLSSFKRRKRKIRSDCLVCEIVQTNSKLTLSEISSSKFRKQTPGVNKIESIFLEEIDKSNQIKKDIEDLLQVRNKNPCSVPMKLDLPTKDISAETSFSSSKARAVSSISNFVENFSAGDRSNKPYCLDNKSDKITGMTDFISKTKITEKGPKFDDFVQEYYEGSDSTLHKTIALNTEPLGWSTLVRMTTDTLKQVLSFVPHLNYLPLLHLPLRNNSAHYICNFCGAAFAQPSLLNDHIQQHNFGATRDCCICRHVLDSPRQNSHFTCQYCGQRFTRAYCCELHQHSCAKHFGKRHDVPSSRMLLR